LLPNLVYLNIGYNELNILPTKSDPDLSILIQEIINKYSKVGEEIAKKDLINIENKKNDIENNKTSNENKEYIKEYNYALRAYAHMKWENESIGIK